MKRDLVDLAWFRADDGADIFVLTGQKAKDVASPAVVLSYVVSGVSAMLSVFCYTEFAFEISIAGACTYVRFGSERSPQYTLIFGKLDVTHDHGRATHRLSFLVEQFSISFIKRLSWLDSKYRLQSHNQIIYVQLQVPKGHFQRLVVAQEQRRLRR